MPQSIDTPDSYENKIDELLAKLSRDLQGLNTKHDFAKAYKPTMVKTPTKQDQYYYHFLRQNPELLKFIESTPRKAIKERLSVLGLSNGILNTVVQHTKTALDASGENPNAQTVFSDETGVMSISHQRIAELLTRAN